MIYMTEDVNRRAVAQVQRHASRVSFLRSNNILRAAARLASERYRTVRGVWRVWSRAGNHRVPAKPNRQARTANAATRSKRIVDMRQTADAMTLSSRN